MEVLTEEQIRQFLAVDCPRLDCLNEIDSTNSYLAISFSFSPFLLK